MLKTRIQQFIDSLREGFVAGFVVGLVELFVILIGVPINVQNLALFSLFLIVILFGIRLARHLREQSLAHLIKNALALGVVASLIVFLFMSLINSWQSKQDIDVKTYFESIKPETMTVLSGVPADELFANPPKDPITGEYPEGRPLRTNPMRLTFDSDTGLRLKLGLAGSAWFDINLIIGGFYGFMLLTIGLGLAAALLTRAAIVADLGHYQAGAAKSLTGNPITHWVVLLLPLLFFALLWLTEPQGSRGAVFSLGSSSQEVQLLLGFGIILWALVAVRTAQATDSGLTYPVRLAVVLGVIALLLLLGIWRIVDGKTYVIATSDSPRGSELLTVLALVIIGGLVAAYTARSLRKPGQFETLLAGSQSLLVLLLMPLYLDQYQNDVMTLVGINILLGLGLNIVVGYAGLLDLGYVAFFALGAYTYAFLSSNQEKYSDSGDSLGLKFAGNDAVVIKLAGWIVITIIITVIVVYVGNMIWQRRRAVRHADDGLRRTLIDLPRRPTRGVTILLTAIAVGVSLVVASVLDGTRQYHDIFDNTSPFLIGLVAGVIVSGLSGIMLGIPVLRLRGDYLAIVTLGFGEIIRLMFNNLRDYTGGPQGILQIPRPLPEGAGGSVTYLSIMYLVFMGAAFVAFFSTRLQQSRTGRAWSAMRSDEDIAQSMGINLVQTKLTAFAIGAAFAGIGGVLFAARQRNIFPGDFKLDVSIEVLSLVIIGGMGSIPGVIMGAIALIGIPEVLRELSTYRILVFGALLIVMVIVRPEGLLPAPMAQLQGRARALAHRQPDTQQEEDGTA